MHVTSLSYLSPKATVRSSPIRPYEVPLPRLPFLDRESVANVQALGSLPTVRLERRIGRLSAEVMDHLKDALAFALDIERAPDNGLAYRAFYSALPLGRVVGVPIFDSDSGSKRQRKRATEFPVKLTAKPASFQFVDGPA